MSLCEKSANKNIASGYCGLDSNTLISTTRIPQMTESQITNLTTDLSECEKSATKDISNGYAGLDGNTCLKVSEFPNLNNTITFYFKARPIYKPSSNVNVRCVCVTL